MRFACTQVTIQVDDPNKQKEYKEELNELKKTIRRVIVSGFRMDHLYDALS